MLSLINRNVALIPIRDAEQIGHIWIPDTAKERVDQGIVKYVGPKCQFARIGAYVTFSGYSGTLFDIADPENPLEKSETLIILDETFLHTEILDMPSTDVPGLYFKDNEGNYFPATFEMGIELCARAMQEADWRIYNPVSQTGINVRPIMPAWEEKSRFEEKK